MTIKYIMTLFVKGGEGGQAGSASHYFLNFFYHLLKCTELYTREYIHKLSLLPYQPKYYVGLWEDYRGGPSLIQERLYFTNLQIPPKYKDFILIFPPPPYPCDAIFAHLLYVAPRNKIMERLELQLATLASFQPLWGAGTVQTLKGANKYPCILIHTISYPYIPIKHTTDHVTHQYVATNVQFLV